MENEPIVYEFMVDGVTLFRFTKKPGKEIRKLFKLRGVTTRPEIPEGWK